MPERPAVPDGGALLGNVVWFTRVLRRMGLPVGPREARTFVRALGVLDIGRKHDVKTAGRAVYVHRADERDRFDSAFEMFWRRATIAGGASPRLPRIRQAGRRTAVDHARPDGDTFETADPLTSVAPGTAGDDTTLRTMDFAELTKSEVRDAEAMIERLRPALPRRRSRRVRLARRGQRLAPHRMLRRSLATGGEILEWRWWRRRRRPRPLVFLLDVSGSMERYTRFLLRFAHALAHAGAPVEVFVFGTRLSRVTKELATHDADRALEQVGRRVLDWSGGTRIGSSVAALNRAHVGSLVRPDAVVLIASDGWERDDPKRLTREMERLRRSCHRVIWLDPFAGRPGFEPLTLGLQAALPHVDHFLPCGNVATLEALAANLATLTGDRIPRHA